MYAARHRAGLKELVLSRMTLQNSYRHTMPCVSTVSDQNQHAKHSSQSAQANLSVSDALHAIKGGAGLYRSLGSSMKVPMGRALSGWNT